MKVLTSFKFKLAHLELYQSFQKQTFSNWLVLYLKSSMEYVQKSP